MCGESCDGVTILVSKLLVTKKLILHNLFNILMFFIKSSLLDLCHQ